MSGDQRREAFVIIGLVCDLMLHHGNGIVYNCAMCRLVVRCYPEFDKAFTTAEWDDAGQGYSNKGRAQIRKAVQLERTRLWSDRLPAVQPALS